MEVDERRFVRSAKVAAAASTSLERSGGIGNGNGKGLKEARGVDCKRLRPRGEERRQRRGAACTRRAPVVAAETADARDAMCVFTLVRGGSFLRCSAKSKRGVVRKVTFLGRRRRLAEIRSGGLDTVDNAARAPHPQPTGDTMAPFVTARIVGTAACASLRPFLALGSSAARPWSSPATVDRSGSSRPAVAWALGGNLSPSPPSWSTRGRHAASSGDDLIAGSLWATLGYPPLDGQAGSRRRPSSRNCGWEGCPPRFCLDRGGSRV